MGTKVSRSFFLNAGEYEIEADLDHQVSLYGFCRGGTAVHSDIFVDGTSIAKLVTRVGGSCSTNSDGIQFNEKIQVAEDGDVEITLQTRGGDCADVYGFWDNIRITPTDADCDGILDDVDQCLNTSPGAVVLDSGASIGCSLEDLTGENCNCDDDWKNHGKYVSCTTKELNQLRENGLISDIQKDELQSQAGESDCGK